jgi:hypothetical protein
MCVTVIDFISVSTIFLLYFGTILMMWVVTDLSDKFDWRFLIYWQSLRFYLILWCLWIIGFDDNEHNYNGIKLSRMKFYKLKTNSILVSFSHWCSILTYKSNTVVVKFFVETPSITLDTKYSNWQFYDLCVCIGKL